jgi:hypothetical protein
MLCGTICDLSQEYGLLHACCQLPQEQYVIKQHVMLGLVLLNDTSPTLLAPAQQ